MNEIIRVGRKGRKAKRKESKEKVLNRGKRIGCKLENSLVRRKSKTKDERDRKGFCHPKNKTQVCGGGVEGETKGGDTRVGLSKLPMVLDGIRRKKVPGGTRTRGEKTRQGRILFGGKKSKGEKGWKQRRARFRNGHESLSFKAKTEKDRKEPGEAQEFRAMKPFKKKPPVLKSIKMRSVKIRKRERDSPKYLGKNN